MKLSDIPNEAVLNYIYDGKTYSSYIGRKLQNMPNGNVLCRMYLGRNSLDAARPNGATVRERKYGIDFFPDSRFFTELSLSTNRLLNDFFEQWNECIIPQRIVYTKKGKTPFVWETLFWPLDKEHAKSGDIYIDEDGIRKKDGRAICPSHVAGIELLVEMKGDIEMRVKNQGQAYVFEDYLQEFNKDVTKFLA